MNPTILYTLSFFPSPACAQKIVNKPKFTNVEANIGSENIRKNTWILNATFYYSKEILKITRFSPHPSLPFCPQAYTLPSPPSQTCTRSLHVTQV